MTLSSSFSSSLVVVFVSMQSRWMYLHYVQDDKKSAWLIAADGFTGNVSVVIIALLAYLACRRIHDALAIYRISSSKNLKSHYGSWAVVTNAASDIGSAFACELARRYDMNILLVDEERRESELSELALQVRRMEDEDVAAASCCCCCCRGPRQKSKVEIAMMPNTKTKMDETARQTHDDHTDDDDDDDDSKNCADRSCNTSNDFYPLIDVTLGKMVMDGGVGLLVLCGALPLRNRYGAGKKSTRDGDRNITDATPTRQREEASKEERDYPTENIDVTVIRDSVLNHMSFRNSGAVITVCADDDRAFVSNQQLGSSSHHDANKKSIKAEYARYGIDFLSIPLSHQLLHHDGVIPREDFQRRRRRKRKQTTPWSFTKPISSPDVIVSASLAILGYKDQLSSMDIWKYCVGDCFDNMFRSDNVGP